MATCKAAKATYNEAVKALIELDPPVATRHTLSALVAKKDDSKEICQNHLQGKCIHGDKCFRIHEPVQARDLLHRLWDATRETGSSSRAINGTLVLEPLSYSRSPRITEHR